MRIARPLALSIALAALFVIVPATVFGTVEPPVVVRWMGPSPSTASGAELFGRFEILAGVPGTVENLEVEGSGWRLEGVVARGLIVLSKGGSRSFDLRGRPAVPGAPLVVKFTFNGVAVRHVFPLDAESLVSVRPAIVSPHGPLRSPKPGGSRTDNDLLRIRGRLLYVRDDGAQLGVDNMRIRFLDDDALVPTAPSSELMWEGYTATHGNFDVFIKWNDCDISGCDDPDIFFEVYADNAWVIAGFGEVNPVQYAWPSGYTIPNFTGNDANFGDLFLPDNGAGHVFTSITRAHREGAARGAMNAGQVSVLYPSANGTSYNTTLQRIRIENAETWGEGTHFHEYGHHLSWNYSVLTPPNYVNGYCDMPTPGHCVWCPENPQDAWQEGWANWYGSLLLRSYATIYGITPLGMNDNRYILEAPLTCGQDNTAYPNTSTEGYVGMLLRDIDDPENDDQTAPNDCDQDVMILGDDEIFTVFRDDDPTSVTDFIAKFRTRYPYQDQDLWSTARNSASAFAFSVPAPIVSGPAGAGCRVIRTGETMQLPVVTNGSLLVYFWQRNGVSISDGGGITGTNDSVLTLSAATPAMSGTYACRVFSCDGTQVTMSRAIDIRVQDDPAPRPMVSWGSNNGGQAADGTVGGMRTPGMRPVANLVAVDGGQNFSAALHADGTVSTWGYAANGWELGNGYFFGTQPNPAPVAGLDSVMQVATGNHYTVVLRRDGTVWGWGDNFYGQLGDGTVATVRLVPSLASEVEGCVRAIATGYDHSLALLADGTVLAWGSNNFGQLGRGTTSFREPVPMPVNGLTGVVAISAAGYNGMALKADGTVWTWGYNWIGQLGDGTQIQRTAPVQVSGLSNVRAIRMQEDAGFAILNDGTCRSWGSNQSGLLGDGSGPQLTHRLVPGPMPGVVNPLLIEGSDGGWCLALKPDGTVLMWGYNDMDILGRPEPIHVFSPTPVASEQGTAPAMITGLGTGFITAYAFGYTNTVLEAGGDSDWPRVLALRASPNPSFARTRLAFDLPHPGRVSLSVYDVTGRRVRALLDEFREPGRYDFHWDGRGESGGASLAGVYFARLELNGMVLTERVVRIR